MQPDPDAQTAAADEHPFARFVHTLGRGPGRSRSLTREEAREALGMVLRGEAEPQQIGAFLMLLRFRGEDLEEVTGLVEAARAAIGAGAPAGHAAVDLDWPSYGAGRTRGAPWFLLAALALARSGRRVLMHGSNEFSSGMAVPEALRLLGLHPAANRQDALRLLDETGFAYLPLAAMSPALDELLGLRRLLGLRSPINTVARLLDPFDARAGVDGVFHPPYIALHLGAAERLGRLRLLVLKGGGGEVERSPGKPVLAHLHDRAAGSAEMEFPATLPGAGRNLSRDIRAVWQGEAEGPELATVLATLALALLALGDAASPVEADARAAEIWRTRMAGAAVPEAGAVAGT